MEGNRREKFSLRKKKNGIRRERMKVESIQMEFEASKIQKEKMSCAGEPQPGTETENQRET